MESYREKMQRKVNEAKLRHDTKYQDDKRIGNAIIAIMSIIGGICATITMAVIVCKLLI